MKGRDSACKSGIPVPLSCQLEFPPQRLFPLLPSCSHFQRIHHLQKLLFWINNGCEGGCGGLIFSVFAVSSFFFFFYFLYDRLFLKLDNIDALLFVGHGQKWQWYMRPTTKKKKWLLKKFCRFFSLFLKNTSHQNGFLTADTMEVPRFQYIMKCSSSRSRSRSQFPSTSASYYSYKKKSLHPCKTSSTAACIYIFYLVANKKRQAILQRPPAPNKRLINSLQIGTDRIRNERVGRH